MVSLMLKSQTIFAAGMAAAVLVQMICWLAWNVVSGRINAHVERRRQAEQDRIDQLRYEIRMEVEQALGGSEDEDTPYAGGTQHE